jgi:hypothetical protein
MSYLDCPWEWRISVVEWPRDQVTTLCTSENKNSSVFRMTKFVFLGVRNAGFYCSHSIADYQENLLDRLFRHENPVRMTPAAARKLTERAINYARGLGFSPAADYKRIRTGFRIEADRFQPDSAGLEFHPARLDRTGRDARENSRSFRMPRGNRDVPLPCEPCDASLSRRRPLHMQNRSGTRTLRQCDVASCVGYVRCHSSLYAFAICPGYWDSLIRRGLQRCIPPSLQRRG